MDALDNLRIYNGPTIGALMADIKSMSPDDRECLWLAIMAKQSEALQDIATDIETIAQWMRDRAESEEEIIAPGSAQDY